MQSQKSMLLFHIRFPLFQNSRRDSGQNRRLRLPAKAWKTPKLKKRTLQSITPIQAMEPRFHNNTKLLSCPALEIKGRYHWHEPATNRRATQSNCVLHTKQSVPGLGSLAVDEGTMSLLRRQSAGLINVKKPGALSWKLVAWALE